MISLPTAYLPPIPYFALIIQQQPPAFCLEHHENFVKQSHPYMAFLDLN